MPTLNERFFQGDDPIPADIMGKLFVDSPTKISEAAARSLGWDGKLTGAVVLHLAENGATVRRGFFNLIGKLADEPIVLPASKIWMGAARDTTITITLPPADAFSFLDGNLCSDYMDQDEIQFAVAKGNTPILPPHYRQNGINGLSLRMLAHVARGSNGRGGLKIKLTLLAFPLDVDDLRQESEATQSAAWAGIKIFEAESPLFPAAPMGGWGNPLYPLLYQPNQVQPCTASNKELRAAISAIMCGAAAPTACTNTTALHKFWETMSADPEAAEPAIPHITWPVFERPEPELGKEEINSKI
jgi:hypothetical protein